MATDFDDVIVGAGAAGLSLAVQLAKHRKTRNRRVLLLDPRTEYEDDRTFCAFELESHAFSECVTHRWKEAMLASARLGARTVRLSAPYCHIPGKAFYDQALREVGRVDSFDLKLGIRANGVEDDGHQAVVKTSAGDITADRCFDGRPPTRRDDGELRQVFLGWFVRSERPVFDHRIATLMDFRLDQSGGIHFMYVLPFDAHTALVEDTYFCAGDIDDETHQQTLREYIDEHVGEVEVTRVERGVIPMSRNLPAARPAKRIYRIGTSGGLARPSTGYAFSAIQRHSVELARRLAQQEFPEAPEVRSARASQLDTMFLTFLLRHPTRAPDMFVRLFERLPSETLARFLNDRGTALDDLRMVAAVRDPRIVSSNLASRFQRH